MCHYYYTRSKRVAQQSGKVSGKVALFRRAPCSYWAVYIACANPNPEIYPDEAKAGCAAVVSTGRSDFPNQVNNVLCFPGIFRGALDVRSRDINIEMELAAANAIAGLVGDELIADYILPKAFDPRVKDVVANAVAKAARESEVARK